MYFLCYFIFFYLHSEILGVFVFEFSGSLGLRFRGLHFRDTPFFGIQGIKLL